MSNWRADVSNIDSLDDCDPLQFLVYIRHSNLSIAKQILFSMEIETASKDDVLMFNQCCELVDKIQCAIDIMHPYVDIFNKGY